MIKRAQREQLPRELFDETVVEVESDGVRYIVWRNPVRALDLGRTREEKYARLAAVVKQRNEYLHQHGRARIQTAVKQIEQRCRKLKIEEWVTLRYYPKLFLFMCRRCR